MDTPEKRRWYCPTPGWLFFGLLVVEGLLWLSERYRWFWFNEKKGWTVLIAVAVVGGAMLVMLLWFIVALVLRWRFQFSIRSLLILVVVVAIPCSWLGASLREARREREAAAALDKLYESVWWSEPSGPDWLRDLFGDGFLSHVDGVAPYGQDVIDDSRLTDAVLENLKDLSQLRCLSLNYTEVTDTGLENLKGLKQLEDLGIRETRITDAGLKNLKGLLQLQRLDLCETKVTDAGLEYLKRLNRLQKLSLHDTKVTDDGVKKLQKALPNCKILR